MNILSVVYMLVYVMSGISISRLVFRHDRFDRRIFFGLVFGLAMLLWLPVLFAFVIKFTVTAQLLAAFVAAAGGAACLLGYVKKAKKSPVHPDKQCCKLKPMLWTVIPLVIIGWVLIINHNIVPASNGSLHSGQSTYGDTCMHLGFITSISVQCENFPPDYSILPGTALGYPFLCDSVSSTFYTLGASLRFAAILPSLYAYLVAVLGVWFFFDAWFKKNSVSVLATYLFFIGGGLGFAYIFNNKQLLSADGIDRWKEMLEGFYKTPTNLPAEGLRWVNAIADMAVPQRATLFGWALLFPSLQLLYRAAIEKERSLFIPLGVLAGCLPLVHTHSFLAIGLISIALLIITVRRSLLEKASSVFDAMLVHLFGIFTGLLAACGIHVYIDGTGDAAFGSWVVLAACLFFTIQTLYLLYSSINLYQKNGARNAVLLSIVSIVLIAIAGIGVITGRVKQLSLFSSIIGFVFLTVRFVSFSAKNRIYAENGHLTESGRQLLSFLCFGVIAVLLAAPQLFGFTFKQASNEHFLRWNFNWDNESDSFLWFYIKNLGLIFILLLPSFLYSKKDTRAFYCGGLLIWLICEIILFQPNPYDNNKLLFVWFALSCGIVADFLVDIYGRLCLSSAKDDSPTLKRIGNTALALMVLVSLFLSGTLTLVREYRSGDHLGFYEKDGKQTFGLIESGYEPVSSELVRAAEWIKENTEPSSTFLTHNNHNNAVAMLTGRNIFVGSSSFLYYHGVNFQYRVDMLKALYEQPGDNLLRTATEYGIDYVLVSYTERSFYPNMDNAWFDANLQCVYNSGGVTIYKLK